MPLVTSHGAVPWLRGFRLRPYYYHNSVSRTLPLVAAASFPLFVVAWLMDNYVTIALEGSIPEGQAITAALGDQLIAIFRQQDKYYAITDVCPHMGASLAEGYVEHGIVTCPWHAWRFRIADGTWCDNPSIKIDAYPVRVVDGEIQVSLDRGSHAPPG